MKQFVQKNLSYFKGARVVQGGNDDDANAPRDDAAILPAPTTPDEDNLPVGWFCMKKVVMEEETEYDYEDSCHHVTTQNCYETFKTEFQQQKV